MRSTDRPSRRRRRGAATPVRRGQRRIRPSPEVPAVAAPRVPAPPPRPHRRPECPRDGGAHCTAMARGGIYDQLAGGFARYAVDVAWVVPHFEKMLYDNALLLRVYAHWWRATGSPLAERVARETADFMLRDLGTAEGGFASALDADAAGSRASRMRGAARSSPRSSAPTDAERAADLLRVTDDGTFEDGLSTLQLPVDPADPELVGRRPGPAAHRPRRRPQPDRDDKVVTAWNGLAIAALADLGVAPRRTRATSRPRLARRRSSLDTHLVDGRLRRSSRGGSAGQRGRRRRRLRRPGRGPARPAPGHRRAPLAGRRRRPPRRRAAPASPPPTAASTTPPTTPRPLFTRPRALGDNVEPSGTTSLAGALLTYGALTGSTRHLDAASAAVDAVGAVAAQNPRFAGLGPRRRRGPRRRTPPGRGRRDRARTPTPCSPVARAVDLPGTRPRWPANPTRPAYPCWPTGRWSRVGPPPTSAGDSSATGPTTDPDELRRQLQAANI